MSVIMDSHRRCCGCHRRNNNFVYWCFGTLLLAVFVVTTTTTTTAFSPSIPIRRPSTRSLPTSTTTTTTTSLQVTNLNNSYEDAIAAAIANANAAADSIAAATATATNAVVVATTATAVATVVATATTTLATASVEEVEQELQFVYGHDQVRRMQATMAKSNYLNANPTINKRHMTYGEFPLSFFKDVIEVMAELLRTSSSTNNDSGGGTFVDLGSGVGRLTLAASLLAPVDVWQSSVGLEIVAEHHTSALEAYDKAEESGLFHDFHSLSTKFICGDAFDPTLGHTTFKDVTAVFAYSTAFDCDDPETLIMGSLSDNLAFSLVDGAIVAMTDRKLRLPFVLCHDPLVDKNPEKGGPEATSTVYIYRLDKEVVV